MARTPSTPVVRKNFILTTLDNVLPSCQNGQQW
jgi:hypothetical protein